LAHCRGYPLLVLVEDGVRTDGLLEKGFDWYVQTIKLDVSSLHTPEFNGVLASWKEKIRLAGKQQKAPASNPADLTVGQLLGALRPAQLWSLLAAMAGVIGAAFALGATLIGS